VNKNLNVGRNTKKPITAAIKTSLLIFKSDFLKQKKSKITKSGETTLAVLKVYIEKAKETAEIIKYHFLFSAAARKPQTPRIIKNEETFASKAARERRICQGEIARKRAEKRAYFFLFSDLKKILCTKKKVNKTVSVPKIAAGSLVANSFKPNNLTGITSRYAYIGGLKSPNDSK
jgi:hypothetical protein